MERKNVKSEPIILIADNTSDVNSGEVELFDLQNIDINDNRRGKSEVLTEKFHNETQLEVKHTSEYGGNPYVQFDMGDDGESFVIGKEVVIKVNGQPKRGIVQEFDDGQGGTIKGFGNPYLFNSAMYQDNGLDYFAFYEGEVFGNYIAGTINDGASTFTFKLNNSDVSADVDENGNWIYEIPEGVEVSNLFRAFYNKQNLISVDLSNIDTFNCTDMSQMFSKCENLQNIIFGTNFRTINVRSTNLMFDSCSSLTSLDLSTFNTGNVTNMTSMFYKCTSLTSLNLSSFNTESVTDMASMFFRCSSLTSLDLSSFNTGNVTNMTSMFDSCSSLTSLDLSTFNTENVTNMTSMFSSCGSLQNIIFGTNFRTARVESMGNMFYSCSSLTSLDLSTFNTENSSSIRAMFASCSSLTSLDLSTFNTENVTNMSWLFSGCRNLQNIIFGTNFRTTNVTDMSQMFNGCSSLTSLDLSTFNTENVTNMTQMFYPIGLSNINLSNFNTLGVTEFINMFDDVSTLTIQKTTEIWNEDITNAFPNINWQNS